MYVSGTDYIGFRRYYEGVSDVNVPLETARDF